MSATVISGGGSCRGRANFLRPIMLASGSLCAHGRNTPLIVANLLSVYNDAVKPQRSPYTYAGWTAALACAMIA